MDCDICENFKREIHDIKTDIAALFDAGETASSTTQGLRIDLNDAEVLFNCHRSRTHAPLPGWRCNAVRIGQF